MIIFKNEIFNVSTFLALAYNVSGLWSIATNVIGLGEGGLVGCLNLAGCVCPVLPSPCYRQWF